MEERVGPTSSHYSHSHPHTRPVRSSSRNFYSSNSHSFTGPVRKWEKKWVHVSSSPPSIPKQLQKSNASNSSNKNNKPVLLCKWTPLSDKPSGHLPPRKFRYTPIAVLEEQKKLATKRVAVNDKSGEAHQSAKKLAVDADDIFGMLDINQDLMEEYQEGGMGSTTHTSY